MSGQLNWKLPCRPGSSLNIRRASQRHLSEWTIYLLCIDFNKTCPFKRKKILDNRTFLVFKKFCILYSLWVNYHSWLSQTQLNSWNVGSVRHGASESTVLKRFPPILLIWCPDLCPWHVFYREHSLCSLEKAASQCEPYPLCSISSPVQMRECSAQRFTSFLLEKHRSETAIDNRR